MTTVGTTQEGGEGVEWSLASPLEVDPPSSEAAARFRAIRDEHFEFVWRSVRRLGVPDADVDDAAQQVFIVASRRLDEIAAGSERSFLFGTAMRVAMQVRRTLRRRSEVSLSDDAAEGPPLDPPDAGPDAEELLAQRRARALLDEVLETLPLDVRAVFVLFELEEMRVPEIASLLGIPLGTAASRLRRGRELFQEGLARVQARKKRSIR
ncbi:RNA polymerase sigma factor [Polyangium spumosum]|uniref:Sigma-70 family RNA polymerase sigma factor n=1 Tax=Polyangium spumosum TaxID=889282 RepID=A0A6N7PXL0_9BACT|nr:sigma-70 family RNA polymerase sigma factor [Polyangium spumosum]MRG96257.1 sigma-70 family RNA polymerase sigma factor [Polyangium spumosum]